MTKVRCRKCGITIVHDSRNVVGCGCDPDAPTWVYIQPDGRVRGFSQSEWETLSEEQ
jgi:hypothetical protein